MQLLNKYGIERQALAVALIPVLILAVLVESAFLYYRMSEQEQGLRDRAELIARQLAASSEYALFSANRGVLQQLADGVLLQRDVLAVRLRDTDGRLLVIAGKFEWDKSGSRQAEKNGLWQDDSLLVVRQPIVSTQLTLDDGTFRVEPSVVERLGVVELVMSKGRMQRDKFELVFFSLMLTALVLLLSVLAAMRVARRITLPILDMRAAVHDLGEGKLDTRIKRTQVTELNELAQGINEMAHQLRQQQDDLQQRIEKATQALREKKEEAEKADFDKTRFLAAASHDLRQPMHALGLFMGELHNRINTPEQRQIVNKVEEAVAAMSGLLESLLDISRLDAGVVVPQIQEVGIDALIQRLRNTFSAPAAHKFITLRTRSRGGIVSSDPVLLERILLNLLGNAIRYTPQHGTVLLACRQWGSRLRMEVRDSGVGIDASDQARIFEEFVQLENPARDRSKGLGLGLPIVKRLCDLLQYPLSLRSATGAGTTIAIEVPLAGELSQRPPDSLHSAANGMVATKDFNRLKVLVVDDDALVRQGTAGLLASWNCMVATAGSLAEVDRRCTQQFDLVICDYRLPDGTGLELSERIRQQSGGGGPAFILISGDTSPDILQQVASRRLFLLHKPVRPAKLRSLMSSLFSQVTQVAAS